MTKLEQIEYHQAHWKDIFEKLVSQDKKGPADTVIGILKGLELAHDIIKGPSNIQEDKNRLQKIYDFGENFVEIYKEKCSWG